MKYSTKTPPKNKSADYNIDNTYSRYYPLIIPILTIVYFVFSYFSNGFYQDDEVAHYINMRDFWTNPWIIMSNWGKPGWKIFLVLPSLGGFKFVLLINSIISACTAYITILLAKELKLKNTLLAGIFFAFQPLILQLSFRSYAEIFTGLLLALTLYFYFKKFYLLSALLCGLSFTARQESALLALILAVFFIKEKKYLPVIFLGIFPVIMDLIGFLHTGDILWAWTEMKNLSEFNLGIQRSFFHYFEVYIYIIGPVIFTLFIFGLFAPLFSKSDYKDFFSKEVLIYFFLFVVFLFQCYLVAKGTNPGSWRYLLQISPFTSIIALMGFNEFLKSKNKKYILPVSSGLIIITLLIWSREATGLVLIDKTDYTNIACIILVLGFAVFLILLPHKIIFNQFIAAILILTIGFTFYTEKPKQQSPENTTVEHIAEWYKSTAVKPEEVLYDHSLILFYANIYGSEKNTFKILNMKSLSEAPKGSIIIWDSHYSYRPEYSNDTKLDYLQSNPDFKPINRKME
jgi:hypothetical protein